MRITAHIVGFVKVLIVNALFFWYVSIHRGSREGETGPEDRNRSGAPLPLSHDNEIQGD